MMHPMTYLSFSVQSYLSALSVILWHPRKLRDLRKPPHLRDMFSTTGPCKDYNNQLHWYDQVPHNRTVGFWRFNNKLLPF